MICDADWTDELFVIVDQPDATGTFLSPHPSLHAEERIRWLKVNFSQRLSFLENLYILKATPLSSTVIMWAWQGVAQNITFKVGKVLEELRA